MKTARIIVLIALSRSLIIKPSRIRVVIALTCIMVLFVHSSNTVFSKESGEMTLICEPTFVDRKTLRFSRTNSVRPATIIFTINFDSKSVRWWSENFSEENVAINDRTFLVTTSKNFGKSSFKGNKNLFISGFTQKQDQSIKWKFEKIT